MSVARFFWRLLPAPLRYWIYGRTRRPHWWLGAKILVVHDFLRDQMWVHGYRLRRWRAASPADATAACVMHVTGSFDLGGTQTQIKYLCTAASARYDHRAIEIFPELNYLYRQDAAIDPKRYVRGGPFARKLGRMVANRNQRSSQLAQIYKLVRDFRAERPSIVVGWGHEMSVTTFLAAAIARVPHIVFCIRTVNPTYGWVLPPFPELLRRAHRRMLPFVDKVVANSTLLRDDHAKWIQMDPADIAVVANGISIEPVPAGDALTARRRIRAQYGVPDDTILISNVGRFSKEKGQSLIVEANRLLLARGVPRRFAWLLCGDGPTQPRIEALTTELGMTNVIFAGRTREVAAILAASDIFVMPSDFEGMPNAMMEAMAAGVPCVSTRRSGARDIARDGLEALYCDPGDAVGLAQHLLTLLTDPARARALGLAARARIQEFSVQRLVDRFEAVLDDMTVAAR